MYSKFEKKIARKISNNEFAKKIIKFLYQFGIYIVLFPKKPKNSYFIEKKVKLKKVGDIQDSFFGYYDKSPWSKNGKYYLFHTTKKGFVILNLYSFEENKIYDFAKSSAYNFQQGSMLQWLDDKRVIFNDVKKRNLVSRIFNIESFKFEAELPYPIQCLSPNSTDFISLNYKRLNKYRPEYGYNNEVENFNEDFLLEEDGLWKVDLEKEKGELIVSLASLKKDLKSQSYNNKINHVMYSPKGDKIVFLHRWKEKQGRFSQLILSHSDGTNKEVLFGPNLISHFCWRDNNHILVWARKEEFGDRYYQININNFEQKIVGFNKLDRFGDGHPSFSPERRWIITDSYPDRHRMRYLILYDCIKDTEIVIGKFFSPWKFNFSKRCDLHPRWSPDGKKISIDSTHEGKRFSYIIDLTEFLEGI